MIVGSFQKEDALFGRDRDFAQHSFNVDAQNDTTSGNTFPANIAAVAASANLLIPAPPSSPDNPASQPGIAALHQC